MGRGQSAYLQQVVRGIVHQHDHGACADVVDTPRKADQQDGGHMVNDLLLKVLGGVGEGAREGRERERM